MSEKPETTETPRRRVDVGDVTLVWGDATHWKAELREASYHAYKALPIEERLRAALSMVQPRRKA